MNNSLQMVIPVPSASRQAKDKAIIPWTLLFLFILSTLCQAAEPLPRLFFSKRLQRAKKTTVIHYTVKKGDYLYSILRKFHVPDKEMTRTIRMIKTLNPHIKDLNHLAPGQGLFLPATISPAIPAGLSTDTQKIKALEYKVRPGDYLVEILRKQAHLPDRLIFNEAINLCKKLNPGLADLNKLKKGELIYLPLQITTKDIPLKIEFLSPVQANKTRSGKVTSPGKPKRNRPRSKQERPSTKDKLTAPKKPMALRISPKRLCLSILKAVGFEFSPGQELFYPTPKGWVQIALKTTPLAKSPWGQSFLFVPQKSVSPPILSTLEASGIAICPLTDGWKSDPVLVQIQRLSKHKLIYWQGTRPLIINRDPYTLELAADQLIIIKKDRETAYHLFFENTYRLKGNINLLAGFLGKHNIYVHLLNRNQRLGFNQPDIPQEKSIFIPKTSLAELNRHNQIPKTDRHLTLTGLLKRQVLKKEDRSLSWPTTTPRIKITLPGLVYSTTSGPAKFYLDAQTADPYLVAAFNLQGQTCLVIEHQRPASEVQRYP